MKYKVTWVYGTSVLENHMNLMYMDGYRLIQIFRDIRVGKFDLIWELINEKI